MLALAVALLVLAVVLVAYQRKTAARRAAQRVLLLSHELYVGESHTYALCRGCGYAHPVRDGQLAEHTRAASSAPYRFERCPGSLRRLL